METNLVSMGVGNQMELEYKTSIFNKSLQFSDFKHHFSSSFINDCYLVSFHVEDICSDGESNTY